MSAAAVKKSGRQELNLPRSAHQTDASPLGHGPMCSSKKAEGTGLEPARAFASSGFQPGAIRQLACPSIQRRPQESNLFQLGLQPSAWPSSPSVTEHLPQRSQRTQRVKQDTKHDLPLYLCDLCVLCGYSFRCKRKERESNPQGLWLAPVRAECRLQSACPSVWWS